MLFEMNQSLQFEKSFFYDNLSIKLREQLKTGNKITYEQYQKDLQDLLNESMKCGQISSRSVWSERKNLLNRASFLVTIGTERLED